MALSASWMAACAIANTRDCWTGFLPESAALFKAITFQSVTESARVVLTTPSAIDNVATKLNVRRRTIGSILNLKDICASSLDGPGGDTLFATLVGVKLTLDE